MLPDRVKGGLRPSQSIQWKREDGTAEDLTGAILTGTITDAKNVERPIAGTLSVVDGPSGMFRWDFAVGDVAEAGNFDVRFTATFGTAPTIAKTFASVWKVAI